MYRLLSIVPCLAASLVPAAVAAENPHWLRGSVPLEDCMESALFERDGMVIKVEMKLEDDSPVYEFNIRDQSARDWDVECDANRGEIIEIELEVTTPPPSPIPRETGGG